MKLNVLPQRPEVTRGVYVEFTSKYSLNQNIQTQSAESQLINC